MEKRIAYVLYKMIGLIALIGIVSAWQWGFVSEGIMAHVYTTGSILSAFAFSIIMAFIFVLKLKNEVVAFNALKEMWDDIRIGPNEQARDPLWRHYRCSRPGRLFKRPRLLGHAYDLVTEELARTKKIRLSVETMNTLVHKISQTIDDEKSLLGYMSGLLVFMGLIGTFIGLLDMVGSIGNIIGQLATSSGGAASADAFQQLLGALQQPLKGMASGFAASLFGLFTSLVVGLLARMAGQAAGVLKHEFEAWLAGVVQIGDEEYGKDKTGDVANSGSSAINASLVMTVQGIVADYSRVAGNFDHTVRLLGEIQQQQAQQAHQFDHMSGSLARFGGGLELLSNSVASAVTAELTATRLLIKEMEQSHAANVRGLAANHAQTAVQIAAAIERNVQVSERMPLQVSANIESRIEGVVSQVMQPIGASLAQQMSRLDGLTADLARKSDDGASIGSQRDLEAAVAEGFDRLNDNISAAFSAYSDVVKLAVSGLEAGTTAAGPSVEQCRASMNAT